MTNDKEKTERTKVKDERDRENGKAKDREGERQELYSSEMVEDR